MHSYLNILWSPKESKLSFGERGSGGDFRLSYSLSIFCENLRFDEKKRLPIYQIGQFHLSLYVFGAQKKSLFVWKKITEEEIQPSNMHHLIEDAIALQLNTFVRYITCLNVATLFETGSDILRDREQSFRCNECGVIKCDPSSFKPDDVIFTIKLEGAEVSALIIIIIRCPRSRRDRFF